MADANHRPGEPPEIRDEAADTPMWVPAAGLALLLLGAVFLVWQSSSEDTVGEAVEQAVERAVDEPADEPDEAPAGDVDAVDPHAGHNH